MDLHPASSPSAARERWLVAGVIAGTATLLALIETSRNYLGNALSGRPVPWLSGLTASAPTWIFIAALTPLPLMLARRVPIVRVDLARALGIHLAGALTFAACHTLALTLYASYQRSTLTDFDIMLSKSSSVIAVDMMMYAAIVGASHALRFYREARARELTASQLQASLTEARLAALRGQLNPHFLFNTLNAISTMALKGEQDNVVRTLGYLGELLRVSLDDELPQEVPLGDELAFLERYLDIQRSRFGDRLAIHHDIAPDTVDAMVPSMILQPFVENAVTHGIAETPGPGEIRIRTERRGTTLVLEVKDSGPGPSAEHRPRPANGTRSGTGLTNTRARLAQLYGDAQTLTLGSAGSRGACVSVSIPFRLAAPAVAGTRP